MVENGDLEQWDDENTPTGWDLMENISRQTDPVHGGTYSAGHMSAPSSQKFHQVIPGVIGGQQYTISYYFLDNVDNAKTRIWSYWLDSEGSTLSDNADELKKASEELTAEWYKISEKIYKAAAGPGQPGPGGPGAPPGGGGEEPKKSSGGGGSRGGKKSKKDDDNVVDADYKVVDE